MCAHNLRFKVYGFKPLLTLWYIFNVIAMVWFGFVHQAGVMPVQKFIGRMTHDDNPPPYINLVYSHTYMPPRFPLFQPTEFDLDTFEGYITNNNTKYLVQVLIFWHLKLHFKQMRQWIDDKYSVCMSVKMIWFDYLYLHTQPLKFHNLLVNSTKV